MEKFLDSAILILFQVKVVIGGSLGGMQALEWAFLGKHFVKNIIAMCCGSQQSACKIGINFLQQQAIQMDPLYQCGEYSVNDPPVVGLSLARQISLLSYRTPQAYNEKFGRSFNVAKNMFEVQSYLNYQGSKMSKEFDANSYITLMKLMNSYDIGRDRGGTQNALAQILQPALVIGIDSDLLYPLREQQELDMYLPRSRLEIVHSIHGHDGFLLEHESVGRLVLEFLESLPETAIGIV